jgi:heptosyltransferase II
VSADRVLVLLKSYLGDAVMATSLLRSLQVRDLTVFAPKIVHDLLKSPEHQYRPLVSDRIKGLGPLLREASNLRAMKFKSAIIVNRSFRTALLAKFAGIPQRIGHATEGRTWLLTDPIPYSEIEPESKSYADLAAPLGIQVTDLTPRLWVSDAERKEGRRALANATVAIQPGARYPAKTIPPPVLTELACRFLSEGLGLALIGGKDEVQAAASFPGECVNLIGSLPLRGSMGAVSGLKVLVGGDTGMMHVAAGVGCPTVTVFGPTPSDKWGHHNAPHQIVRAEGSNIQNITSDQLWEAALRAMAG